MDFFKQGALEARQCYKVADILETRIGRKIFRQAIRTVIDPEGKPRLIRTLEPYYDEYVNDDPEAFNNFDARLRQRQLFL